MTATDISLGGRGDLVQGYETGHIYGRPYDANNLPSSKELISDLKELLASYKEIEYMMGEMWSVYTYLDRKIKVTYT
jgi:5-methylcytosine-specific restriction protein A